MTSDIVNGGDIRTDWEPNETEMELIELRDRLQAAEKLIIDFINRFVVFGQPEDLYQRAIKLFNQKGGNVTEEKPQAWTFSKIDCWAEDSTTIREKLKAKNKRVTELESELHCFKTAYNLWLLKTDWVQEKKDWAFPVIGMHRADILKQEIERLQLKNAELETAVAVARESRDAADSKAKEAAQKEMASLRAELGSFNGYLWDKFQFTGLDAAMVKIDQLQDELNEISTTYREAVTRSEERFKDATLASERADRLETELKELRDRLKPIDAMELASIAGDACLSWNDRAAKMNERFGLITQPDRRAETEKEIECHRWDRLTVFSWNNETAYAEFNPDEWDARVEVGGDYGVYSSRSREDAEKQAKEMLIEHVLTKKTDASQ